MSWLTDDRVDRATLDELVERIAPIVEEITGREFDRLPPVVIADLPRLERVLVEEQLHLMRMGGALPADHARQAARENAAEVASSFVGKYGFLDGNLYVVPDGVRFALLGERLDPELAPGVLTLVVAHELTHALQDQQSHLDVVASMRGGSDGLMAANCVVEGHAVWVHEQVGVRLGLTAEVAAVAQILGYELDDPERIDPERFRTSYLYGQGRTFVDWHIAADGIESIWRILAEPPASSSMIVNPETYSPVGSRPPPAGLLGAMRRGRDRLAEPGWSAVDEEIGDYDLRERMLRDDAPEGLADRVASAWTARRTGDDAGAEVELIRFDTPGDASSYVMAMYQHSSALVAEAVGESNGAVEGLSDLWDVLPAADLAAREIIALPELDGQRMSTHWVASGPLVVQVVLVNAPPTERQVAAQIRRVLRRVE